MTMLYKVAEGTVKETHYGLQLARVVPFPPGLVDRAAEVSQKLERYIQQRKKTSVAVTRERRRKLILNLKEHLVQAHNSVMEGDVLAAWLRELQKEFVTRMTAIDEEAARTELASDNENGEDDGMAEDGYAKEFEDEELVEQSDQDERDVEMDERHPGISTRMRQRSVITVSSRISPEDLESASSMRAVSEN
jgi:DNA mismatch repair protein MSH4